jgi:hypothetical protein
LRTPQNVPPIPITTSKIATTMTIKQPFAKQPDPRFGGGSGWVFIFVILCGS